MQVTPFGWRIVGVLGVTITALHPMTSLKAQSINPWTPERTLAVVRIEVPQQRGPKPSVGTGFVVKGHSGRFYVLTSTRVLLPEYDPTKPLAAGCNSLLNGTVL